MNKYEHDWYSKWYPWGTTGASLIELIWIQNSNEKKEKVPFGARPLESFGLLQFYEISNITMGPSSCLAQRIKAPSRRLCQEFQVEEFRYRSLGDKPNFFRLLVCSFVINCLNWYWRSWKLRKILRSHSGETIFYIYEFITIVSFVRQNWINA